MGANMVNANRNGVSQGSKGPGVRVQIYVADHCQNCQHAYVVAEMIRQEFPQVELEIVNLSQTREGIPEAVFATPTYLLNGRLWSLGNPSVADVQERLAQAVEAVLDGPGTSQNASEKSA